MMSSRTLALFLFALFVFLLIAVSPALALQSSEQSLSESLTRGSRFTATVTGSPNTTYYVWLTHTSSMTGQPYDQPPVIADNTENVRKDPAGGPYTIGSYQYNNGNGQTIRDDVAPSTTTMSSTNYYAQVTTNNAGQGMVEFQTSLETGLRSYSVKVENPTAPETTNLLVEVKVYSRKAPAIVVITPEPTPRITVQPTQTTLMTATVITTLPEPTEVPRTTATTPAAQPPQQTTTTKKAAAGIFLATGSLVVAALCLRWK